ncbi:sulfurtransferase-like selenium metabolism protein YedF [Desulfovibrio mangrovi]|uniref:sulfurtransferase-like selenium metabolism protein YedF n=1 Tax=Desulfovibrio mangrovi TaxID=2976983 RepID=UPI0022480743|nr:sulfurtransferase-like selenium metabolism protein YedF [Desulfovibrio mangrovi]UZP68284.1 sulfurtransferase-like selenium metabolism protein YedF [Desulfovibrio mangrovi]
MPEIELNCQNLACPQPVLECKKLIESSAPAAFSILLDNEAAKENVTRFVSGKGYSVAVEAVSGGWRLVASGGNAKACDCEVMTPAQMESLQQEQKVCVFIASDVIGTGNDELGGKLMKNFLATLPELGKELWRIVLVNGGVKLAVKDSPVIAELQKLEAAGATILVCGTCLDFFGILDAKAVGQTTNMLDVVTSMQLATKVIRP